MKKLTCLHPFLIALVPIASLLAINIDVVGITAALLPALGSLLLAGLLVLLIWSLRRDYTRSTIIASVILVAFLYYGRVFYYLWVRQWFQEMWHLHALLATVSLCAVVGSGIIIWRTRRSLEGVVVFLTVAPIVLLISSGVMIAIRLTKGSRQTPVAAMHNLKPNWPPPVLEDSDRLPDVYHIILDGYGRADALKAVYGVDNSLFLDELRKRGFYVVDLAISNYTVTYLSLASTLNMRYVHDDAPFRTERQFYELIQKSEAVNALKGKGYRYVHFATNWLGTGQSQWADTTCQSQPWIFRDEFTSSLLRLSALCPLEPTLSKAYLAAFDKLGEVPTIRGPTFTLAHMLVTHPPCVFDQQGNVRRNIAMGFGWRLKEQIPYGEKSPYIENLLFANQKTLEAIDRILDRSPVKPIIILHADHGFPWLNDRNIASDARYRARIGILCALYVPEKCRRELYPTMSSVNIYRLILKTCFEDEVDRLPDKSYYHYMRDNQRIFTELPSQVKTAFQPDSLLETKPDIEPWKAESSPWDED